MEYIDLNDGAWLIMRNDHDALKAARELRGLSIEETAELIGVTTAKYKAYESGRYHYYNAPKEIRDKIRTLLDPQGLVRLDESITALILL